MKFIQKHCLYGDYILIVGDLICHMMNESGYFAKFEIEFFRSFLREGDDVIEIGAFIGTHSIPIKKMIKNGKIMCFEPQQHIFKVLCSNLLLNDCNDVITLPYGIGKEKFIQTGWKNGNQSQFSLIDTSKYTSSDHLISIKSIKNFSEYYNTFTKLKLIKIDVEGMELEVLDEISDLIIRHRPFIFIEYDNHSIENVKKYFDKFNYDCFYFNTSLHQYYKANTKIMADNLNGPVDIDDIRVKNFGDYNLFAIPKEFPSKPNLPPVVHYNTFDVKKINDLSDLDLNWYQLNS